jgi:hypothetical protein
VGFAVNLPGAVNIERYWSNTVNGMESITLQPLKKTVNVVLAFGLSPYCGDFDIQFLGLNKSQAQQLYIQERWLPLFHPHGDPTYGNYNSCLKILHCYPRIVGTEITKNFQKRIETIKEVLVSQETLPFCGSKEIFLF